MGNVAWIMKNFKTSVHDPRILSYSVEAGSEAKHVKQRDAWITPGVAADGSSDEQATREAWKTFAAQIRHVDFVTFEP